VTPGLAQTVGLYRYDLTTGKLEDKPLFSIEGFDFHGQLVLNAAGTQLAGVHYEGDGPGTVWFEAGMKAHQARVDKLLPTTYNRLSCRRCGEDGQLLVEAYSDRQPPTFLLFDAQKGELQRIGAARPWINPNAMGQRDFVRFKARDGLVIPAYVTRPPKSQGKGPWPMVVLVHGGPWVRGGHWAWNPDAQFLATRGYLVVEPEFRGSRGYGNVLYRAGFKQWGLAMQDDVADAATWAIDQGLADRQRVCIAGASYGGYATLMGLIKNPEIFRCGVEWLGVTDIDLMYTITWSDMSTQWKELGMPELVGDRIKDAAQLEATSPLKQAARLAQPLLMAYGSEDLRVPIKHGTAFRDAVVKTNPNVEWIEYPGEGHGFYLTQNRVDFWTHVEAFLARHLRGDGATAGPAGAAR
jgi:dipeptidyl aminopeptidase/acylaminoacyl peptidase